ncbi:hypothetical protein ACP70R_031250 [Stipagrostis hirtigluma subsp. patula]
MEQPVEQQSSKKARMESPMAPVKQEAEVPEEEESSEEGAAVVPVDGAAARVELTVRLDRAKLHCPVCTLALKPPIYQCAVGHLACSSCHGQLLDSRCYCYVCDNASTFTRVPAMEEVICSSRVLCPYDVYGCRSYVPYFDVGDHQVKCPHAPCRCSEPGCGFVGAPPMLRDHLAAAPHGWPVDTIRYGCVLQLRVPEQGCHRLLVAEEDDDRVFLLSAAAHGAASFRVVTVVCVRASAAAGPQYTCRICAAGPVSAGTGKPETAMVEMAVPSSATSGEVAVEEAASLVMVHRMLREDTNELHMGIRIDKII